MDMRELYSSKMEELFNKASKLIETQIKAELVNGELDFNSVRHKHNQLACEFGWIREQKYGIHFQGRIEPVGFLGIQLLDEKFEIDFKCDIENNLPSFYLKALQVRVIIEDPTTSSSIEREYYVNKSGEVYYDISFKYLVSESIVIPHEGYIEIQRKDLHDSGRLCDF